MQSASRWQQLAARQAPLLAGRALCRAAAAVYYACTTALLLGHGGARQLPLAFALSGALGCALSLAAQVGQRRLGDKQKLAGLLLVLFGGLLLAGALAAGQGHYVVLFAGNQIFTFIINSPLWDAARRGKLVAELPRHQPGFVDGRETGATLAGYWLVPGLLALASPAGLLQLAGAALLGAGLLALPGLRPAAATAPALVPTPQLAGQVPTTYYALLSALALLPALALAYGEFMLVARLAVRPPGAAVLAGGLGVVFGVFALLELLANGILRRWLPAYYSLRGGLLVLPALLLVSYALAALYGRAYGPDAPFLTFLALGFWLMSAGQRGLGEVSWQRLRQVLPTGRRWLPGSLAGAPSALGYLAAGLLLLMLAALGVRSVVSLGYVLLPVLGGWLYVAWRVYPAYREVLRRIVAQAATLLPPAALPKAGPTPEPAPQGLTLEKASSLASSGVVADRLTAAGALGQSGRFYAYRPLLALLDDPELTVREAAIAAAGVLRRPELWPRLLHYLEVPGHEASAQAALLAMGEEAVPALIKHFGTSGLAAGSQARLVSLISQLGGEVALRFLRASLAHPSALVREQAVAGLAGRPYRATTPERLLLLRQLDEQVALLGWLAAAYLDLQPHYAPDSALLQALAQERQRLVPQVFRRLAVAYGNPAYELVGQQLGQEAPAASHLLPELLAASLPDEVKDSILPLVAPVPLAEQVQLSAARYPQQHLGAEARLHDLINQDYAQLSARVRAAAIRELLRWHQADPTALLVANATRPEAELAEAALYVLRALNPTRFATLHASWQARPGTPGLALAGRIAAALPAASLTETTS